MLGYIHTDRYHCDWYSI